MPSTQKSNPGHPSEAQLGEKGIAGAGDKHGTGLRTATALASKYGGKAEDWAKKTSSAYTAKDGSVISQHWFERIGDAVRYELKSIID